MTMYKCRLCFQLEVTKIIDLGNSPPSNSYLDKKKIDKKEAYFPLRIFVCNSCWLVQTEDFVNIDEIFNDEYAYFSNFSSTWNKHCKNYADKVIEKFSLNQNSLFVEIASNDGTLLNYFQINSIPHLGIEPTYSTAQVSKAQNHNVIQEFFTPELAFKLTSEGKYADLIAANNVIAHVPNLNQFITAFTILLKNDGVITFEFPYVLNLFELNQFDTIYHEHFSYFSIISFSYLIHKYDLEIFDIEFISTHGGSIRAYCQKKYTGTNLITDKVSTALNNEYLLKMDGIKFYLVQQEKINNIKNNLLYFLIKCKFESKKVIAYGAAAKGNTFLNYAGIKQDLINFVCDLNQFKQNKFMPGSHIPIYDLTMIEKYRPDYILILPWNIKDEIIENLGYVKKWNCKFVVAIPELFIY